MIKSSKPLSILSLCASVVLLAYCNTPKAVTKTVTPEVVKAAPSKEADNALLESALKRWPGATMALLNHGKEIYNTKCNTCHALKEIGSLDEPHWNKAIAEMAPQARLTPDETGILTKYILSARDLVGK
jgi:cytochrome c5